MWWASIAAGARNTCWKSGEAVNRRISKEWIEFDIVARNIEAGMIENVERIKVVLQGKPLAQFESLEYSEIEPLLKWTAKYVAATTRITVLESVADSAAGITCRHPMSSRRVGSRYSEGCRIQHRLTSVHAGRTLKNRITGSGSDSTDWNDRVRNKILSVAPIDTGSASAEIDYAVRKAALEHRNPIYTPTIGDGFAPSTSGGNRGEIVVIADSEDMSAIKIGTSVGRSGIIGIITAVEESKAALFVKGVRIRISGRDL